MDHAIETTRKQGRDKQMKPVMAEYSCGDRCSSIDNNYPPAEAYNAKCNFEMFCYDGFDYSLRNSN